MVSASEGNILDSKTFAEIFSNRKTVTFWGAVPSLGECEALGRRFHICYSRELLRLGRQRVLVHFHKF